MKDFNPCPENVKQELYFGFWITFESPLTKITSSLFSRIDSMHKLYPDMMNLLWRSKNKKYFALHTKIDDGNTLSTTTLKLDL